MLCGFDRIEKAFASSGSVFPKSIFKFPIKKRKCRTCDTSFCQLSTIVKVRYDFIFANNYYYYSDLLFMFLINRIHKNDLQVYIWGDGCGRGAGRPPDFLDIVKRTEAKKDNLSVVAPQIFGPSAISDDY